MDLHIGDNIIYQDIYGDSFKGVVIDVSTNDNEEITGYFTLTDSGSYIHFHASSLNWVRLEQPVSVPRKSPSSGV